MDWKKKKIAFVSPAWIWGPTSLYESLVSAFENDSELDCHIERWIFAWLRLHFKSDYDVIVTALPFFWRPRCHLFILNLHGDYTRQRSFHNIGSFLAFFYPYTAYFADKLIFPSKFLRDVIGFSTAPNTAVIPNFSNFSFPAESSTHSNGLWNGKKKVLSVMKFDFLDKSRWIIDAISALAKTDAADVTLDFEIIGGGAYLEQMKREALKLPVPESMRIIWTGTVPHEVVANKLRSCDLFVYASHLDTFSISALEAISMGRPTLLNDYWPFPELFPHLAFALEEWPSRLSNLLSDSDFSEQVVREGLADVSRFDKWRVVHEWRNLFADSLDLIGKVR